MGLALQSRRLPDDLTMEGSQPGLSVFVDYCVSAGKDWKSSEAAHEARVAVELGLRPGTHFGTLEGRTAGLGRGPRQAEGGGASACGSGSGTQSSYGMRGGLRMSACADMTCITFLCLTNGGCC